MRSEADTVNPPPIRIPSPPHPASNYVEIRSYVTPESRHLIAAIHNILSKLELSDGRGRDEESFAELKRILKQRIQDLENCAAIPSRAARTAKVANNSA
jgi:hypothetical protein